MKSLAEIALAAGVTEAEAEEVLARLVPPLAPGGRLRDRLLASVAPGWWALVDAFARHVDLPLERARALLVDAERYTSWVAGPLPGVSVMHLPHGAAHDGADVGLVRLGAGVVFPPHEHLGPEQVIVLDGSYTDDRGRFYQPGDRDDRGVGDRHHFVAGPSGVVFVVVLREGIVVHVPGGEPVVIRG